MATMEEALVPLYMYHRYAVDSAASALGGQDYVYAFRGDDRIPTKWVSGAQQRAALAALVSTLAPSELALPKNALQKIPPRPSNWGAHRELFTRYTGEVFDPISPAAAAAEATIGIILTPDRAARMVAQHAIDPTLPGLTDVIGALRTATFGAPAATPYEQEIRRATSRVLAENLMALAANAAMPQVRALASAALQTISGMGFGPGTFRGDAATMALLTADIKRFLERPIAPIATPAAPEAPPGAPIGDPGMDFLARSGWCTWRNH
jgi:hypothetical protein